MSDLFHDDVPLEFIEQVFEVIRETLQHTYQVVTKRAQRLSRIADSLDWPSNLWIGVSVESRRYAFRINHLRRVPAAVRFVSAEPLLGPSARSILRASSGSSPGVSPVPTHGPWSTSGSPSFVTPARQRASRSSSSNGEAEPPRHVAENSMANCGTSSRLRRRASPVAVPTEVLWGRDPSSAAAIPNRSPAHSGIGSDLMPALRPQCGVPTPLRRRRPPLRQVRYARAGELFVGKTRSRIS